MDPRALQEEIADEQAAEVRRVGDAAGLARARSDSAIAPRIATHDLRRHPEDDHAGSGRSGKYIA